MWKAGLGEIAQQCEAGLTNLRHWILWWKVFDWSFTHKDLEGCSCYLDTLIEKVHDVTPSHQPLDVPVQSLIFSDTDASLPICKLTSASPERRSRATIMKSLSGCSNWSAFCTWAMCWLRVCSTRETQRLYTGSQYGRKPSCKAVATLQQTLKNIFLCQTKVFMRHF